MDFRNETDLSLGLRNNNPGNLRHDGVSKWQGMDGTNKGFIVFKTIEDGLRAWLINYYVQVSIRGVKTVRQFVEKYAPASENNVEAYLAAIQRLTGLLPSSPLPRKAEEVAKFLRAVITHENGVKNAVLIGQEHILAAFDRLTLAQRAFFLWQKIKSNLHL